MNRVNRWAGQLALAFALAVVIGAPARAGADEIKFFAPDEKAYGLSLGEWAAAWVQWVASMPKSLDFNTDKTGAREGIGQRLPVWFIPPHPQGETGTTRTILIPAGYAVLWYGPVVFGVDGPAHQTEESFRADLEKHTEPSMASLKNFTATIDGVAFPDVQRSRVQTPLFTVVLPPSNLFDIPVTAAAQDHRVVGLADGYFVLMQPLPIGKHVLHSHYEGINLGGQSVTDDSTFNLIVQEPNVALP